MTWLFTKQAVLLPFFILSATWAGAWGKQSHPEPLPASNQSYSASSFAGTGNYLFRLGFQTKS